MAPASHAFPQSATNHPSPPRSLGAWQSGFGRDNGDFGRLGSNGGRDADWAISLTEGQNQILEKIVEGEPLSIILDALAIMIEAHSDKALYCSFLLFDAAENCLRHGAAPSLPKAYCEQLDGVVIGPNVGSCGTAAYLTASVTVEDISVDPLWDDFSEMALTFGLRSCWSTPVLGKDGKLLAIMGIYHPFPHCPTPSDRRLVNKATYLTRIAIERQTSETKLKQINESLEQKVERRTRDLEAVVENLQEQIRERETAENKLRVQTQVLEQTLKDLQHTQMQMVQSEKMSSLGQLVAGIAHEINNPINFIHGNLSHIEDYSTSLFSIIEGYRKKYSDSSVIDGLVGEGELAFLEEDSRDLVRSMRIGTKRIKGIVRSLRNFARLDEAEYKTVDVHDGIDSALVILGSRLKGTGLRRMIKVEKKYQALPHVDCFPGQLNQVFMNVLSNAIDAIEDRAKLMGGFEEKGIFHIAIATRQVEGDLEGQEENSHVEIAISDRGQGIKPESQPHIFNPFFTTKAVGQGTGLGMSISYQIITQQHNGSLTCESQWGEGTTFRIRIPIHQSL